MTRLKFRIHRQATTALAASCIALGAVANAATVTGVVMNGTNGEPLSGVQIFADGADTGTTTDAAGNFRLDLAAGEKVLALKKAGFTEQSLGKVEISADGEQELARAKLYPKPADDVVMLDALSVEGTLVKGSSGDLQLVKQKADVAIDFLSSDQLAKFSAGDAAEAIIRIPGVSVANGQFAVIRGLSDRFLSTTLHGLKLPSPDPEKQAFQMDLLPTSAVGSIVVSKTYGPELWGESGGGNIDIATNAIPEENYVKLGSGLKFNSNAVKGGVSYPTSGAGERFGFGSGNRPAEGTTPANWQYVPTEHGPFPLGTSFSSEIGRVFQIRDNKLGWRFSAENESGSKTRSGERQKTNAARADNGQVSGMEAPSDLSKFSKGALNTYDETETESLTSFNTTIAYDFAQNHQLKLDAIYVQNGIDTSYLSQNAFSLDENLNFIGGENGDLETFFWFLGNESYRERNLTSIQLSGKHEFTQLSDLRFTWAVQDAGASQKDSPFIETRFASPLANPYSEYVLLRNASAPIALTSSWLDNVEQQRAARVDFVLPRELFAERESELKVGFATDRSERTVDGLTDFKIPLNDLTNTDYVGLYKGFVDSAGFTPSSGSYPLNSDAQRDIDAAYVGTSLALNKWLKIAGGIRAESFFLASSGGARWANLTTNNFYSNEVAAGFGDLLGTTNLTGAEFFAPGADDPVRDPDGDSIIPISSEFEKTDYLPAIGFIVEPTSKTTVRLAYSQTKGRPSMREISPFFNKSIETQNLVVGNPALIPSSVNNYDVRFEWNPAPQDGVALSLFYKQVEQPIEKVILTSVAGDVETWLNNPNTADMTGVEFEFRHTLGRWTEFLNEYSLNGNFTYIHASVDEHPIALLSAVDDFADASKMETSRRLYDQPEYIANLDVTWRRERWGTSATFAAYAISDVLVASGLTNAISIESANFDLYQRSYVRCDFILSQRLSENFKLKFSVKNLFDPVLGTIYDREALGRVVERNSYQAGRNFSLSVAADF